MLISKIRYYCKRIFLIFYKRKFKYFGKGVKFDMKSQIINPENISIGNFTSINANTVLQANSGIVIGDYSRISNGAKIIDTYLELNTFPREHRSKEIYIGKNVWIATNVVIVAGVTIGDNSVVGAGSVVTKNIPNNVFVAGCPAKVIKNIENKNV